MSKRSRIYSPRRGTGLPANARAEAVEHVYRDADGKLPDFTRLDRRPPSWRRWAIGGGLITLALLAVAAWTSFLVFKPYTASSGGNVVLTVDGPPTAPIGGDVEYRVRVANDDRVPVAQVALELTLPEDFTVVTTDPAPEETKRLRWTIGALDAHADRTIVVRGRLFGEPGASARAEAVVIYRPANFNSDFQTIAKATTTLDASPLTVAMVGPTESVPGTPETYTVTYTNTGTATTPPLVLMIAAPSSFALIATTPDRPRREELLWPIGELSPGGTGTITISGSFGASAAGDTPFRATIAVSARPDRRLSQASALVTTKVLGGDVAVTATVNDQTTALTAPPGALLRFRIAIRNTGTAELRGITLRAMLDGTSVGDRSILDYGNITDPANGSAIGKQKTPDVRTGTITWTP
ncbi:hypothetical protein HY480_01910, partial [Candidatus Uhrbacteria bacterium]|nr:hypothetical protein [Candidatus Uhrbacteria bacterium]